MNIALLEDNPSILDYMTIALQMAGHNVEKHIESATLLDTLFSENGVQYPLPYDLVIVDILLPGNISGLEAIRQIHPVIPPETLPIIIVSACSQEELDQIHRELPHVPILRKPFKMSHLLQLIEDMKQANGEEVRR